MKYTKSGRVANEYTEASISNPENVQMDVANLKYFLRNPWMCPPVNIPSPGDTWVPVDAIEYSTQIVTDASVCQSIISIGRLSRPLEGGADGGELGPRRLRRKTAAPPCCIRQLPQLSDAIQ